MVDAKRLVDEMLGSGRSRMKVKIDSFPTLGEAAFGAPGKVGVILFFNFVSTLDLKCVCVWFKDQNC